MQEGTISNNVPKTKSAGDEVKTSSPVAAPAGSANGPTGAQNTARQSGQLGHTPFSLRRVLVTGVVAVVVVIGLWIGVPWVERALTTVSTDNAYVSDYVTFVAPRVSGQVSGCKVEDNNRVHKGQVLVELDPKPYQVKVDIAKADLAATIAGHARAWWRETRGLKFNLQHTIEQVDNQIAHVAGQCGHARFAEGQAHAGPKELRSGRKTHSYKCHFAGGIRSNPFGPVVAEAQVKQALEGVYQTRVSLGLPAIPPKGKELTDVPDDLDETFSSVRQAGAQWLESAAELGVVPSSYDLKPKQMIEEFLRSAIQPAI